MNFEGNGVQIAKVCNNKTNKDKILYLSSDIDKIMNGVKEYKCIENEYMQLIPKQKGHRMVQYTVGPSGSGKSYFTKKYIDELKKMYPKRKVYLFSSLEDDETMDNKKNFKRIKLDEDFLNTTFNIKDFKDAVIVYDDVDCIRNKLLKDKLFGILDVLLQTGRHENVEVIYTSHLSCGKGNDSKQILNEAHICTVFTLNLGNRSSKYLLENYFGITKKQIDKLKLLPSRWISIIKSYPMIILYEKGCYYLHS